MSDWVRSSEDASGAAEVPWQGEGTWKGLRTQLTVSVAFTPERRLALACFEAGICELHASKPGIRRKARRWVHNRDNAWPWSFNALCELFGLDPAAVRRIVLAEGAPIQLSSPGRRRRAI